MTVKEKNFQTRTDMAGTAWTGRTRGGFWGNWFFLQVIRLVGIWIAYILVLPVVVYFVITSTREVRSSSFYMSKVLGPHPKWKRPYYVYRHFLSQAITLLDRVAILLGKMKINCVFENEHILLDTLAEGRGLILVGAHVGNWEVGGHLFSRLDKPITLVVLDNEREQIQTLFKSVKKKERYNVLEIGKTAFDSLPVLLLLRKGETVALHGDRSLAGDTIVTPFLGTPANFPIGPYLLASASKAPLCQAFTVRERLGKYRFFCFPPQRIENLDRKNNEQLKELVSVYVARLESIIKEYPYQWYNFYPFWGSLEKEI